jgi:flagellar biosynthetic protein FlhB
MVMRYDLQWFGKDGPGGEKTEPATGKKLSDARKDGKVAKSREVNMAFGLITLFLCLKIFISYIGNSLYSVFTQYLGSMADYLSVNEKGVTPHAAGVTLMAVLIKILSICAPFFAAGFVVAVITNLVQVKWVVSTKPMQPKLSKLNPLSGFKRIFSKNSLFELFKSVIKVGLITYIAYTSLKKEANDIYILYDLDLRRALNLTGSLIINVGLKISIFYLVVAFVDYVYQKHTFNEDMKMTKQEVKDEYKNTEGDPQIKGQQRKRMQQASRRRMMKDVPKADVVITNPTHLAVALKYDAEESPAPVVLAKGEDYVAQKIKEVARENNVAIVENKPLARMLYHNVDIGQQIPPELYQAVAEVLAAVYQAKAV